MPFGRAIAQPAAAASSVARRRPTIPGTKIEALLKIGRAHAGVARRAHVDAGGEVARDRRPGDQRPRAEQHELPARQLAQRVHDGARDDALVRAQLEHDRLALLRRREELRVDAGREQPVVAGEALLGGVAHLVGERDQRVDAAEQLLARRARGRIAEPVRRDERRDRERVGVAEREVRERRQPGLEAVDDVEAERERLAKVRLHADRDAELRPARDGDRRADRDHVGPLARGERAPAGEQVGRLRRRGDHRHLVPARAGARRRRRERGR